MTQTQLNKIQSIKSIDKILNENEPLWSKSMAFVGKKKTLEGMLLLLINIIDDGRKSIKPDIHQNEQLFALLDKLLIGIDSMMKEHENINPSFYQKYFQVRNPSSIN